MEATVEREGKIFYQDYEKGIVLAPVKEIGKSKKTGTHIKFWPDGSIFSEIRVREEGAVDILNFGTPAKRNTKHFNVVIEDFGHAWNFVILFFIPFFVFYLLAEGINGLSTFW